LPSSKIPLPSSLSSISELGFTDYKDVFTNYKRYFRCFLWRIPGML
jgi:hypothetical protein